MMIEENMNPELKLNLFSAVANLSYFDENRFLDQSQKWMPCKYLDVY